MKTFNKIALVSAIAVAPFTQAMEALDDSVLGNTTGQAGVTIDLSIGDEGVTIGKVVYTDTANTDGTDGGSVVLEDISIKNITKLSQTIDVSTNGNLVMGMSGSSALKNKVLAADGTVTDGATDVGTGVAGIELSIGGGVGSSAVALRSADGSKSAELVAGLDLNVDLGDSTTTIHNLDGANLSVAGVKSDAHKDTAAKMAIQMQSSFRINNLNVGLFGATNAQAQDDSRVTTAKTAISGLADIAYDDDGVATTSSTDAGDLALLKTYNDTLAAVATGSAVQIENLSFLGKDGGMVTANQTIWAVGGDSKQVGSTAGVYIEVGSIAGTMNIGGIKIGGHSIGSVSVSDINLAGMTQRIYGH